MWTLICLIWAIGLVLLLLFFTGAKRLDSPDWDGLHREGDNEKS